MNIECPKCKESFPVVARAIIPKEQELSISLTSENEMFCAKTIGSVISNMEKLQRGVAENMGMKVVVFIKSIDLKPYALTIRFVIIETSKDS